MCSFNTSSWKRYVYELIIKLSAHSRASPHRYSIDNGSLCYRTDAADTSRIGIPQDEELNYRLIYEDHDIARSGHLGREKTYSLVIQINWWTKYINWYALMCLPVRSARVKPSTHWAAQLASFPYPLGVGSPLACTSCLVCPSICRQHGYCGFCRPIEHDGSLSGCAGLHWW